LRFIQSLPDRDFSAGIAESIKKSLIYDQDFYEFILNNSKKIMSRNLESLFEVIYRSIGIKLFHTISDEKEQSIRLLLNYGHTFGQAFESIYGINEDKLRHGEAVSLGMMCAANLSKELFNNNIIISQHQDILREFRLPTKLSDCNNLSKPKVETLSNSLSKDKKKTSSGNRFIVCEKLGVARVEYIQDINLINNSFNSVLI
jgi:3-dehydroquinate synthase